MMILDEFPMSNNRTYIICFGYTLKTRVSIIIRVIFSQIICLNLQDPNKYQVSVVVLQ